MAGELIILTAQDCADRWKVSRDKAVRILKPWVGRGVMDLGSRENVRKKKRGYAILRVPLSVVQEIEALIGR
jgi:hypothetical protein